jgi:Protein of unknown function (DUF3117)
MCSRAGYRREAGLYTPTCRDKEQWERERADWREHSMAAMKPRTGDGPLEATKEGRGIVMRVPLEGGGRLVVELTPEEAAALGDELKGVTS